MEKKLKIKFGGFYSPNLDYKNDLKYIIIGIHDGWYYPTKEEMKLYYDYVNKILYGKKLLDKGL